MGSRVLELFPGEMRNSLIHYNAIHIKTVLVENNYTEVFSFLLFLPFTPLLAFTISKSSDMVTC